MWRLLRRWGRSKVAARWRYRDEGGGVEGAGFAVAGGVVGVDVVVAAE